MCNRTLGPPGRRHKPSFLPPDLTHAHRAPKSRLAFSRYAAEDPELFAAYLTLAADAKSIATAHVDELIDLVAAIIRAGTKEGAFRAPDPTTTACAILLATTRFHHPVHFAESSNPKIDADFNNIWKLLMDGLATPKRPA